MIYQEECLKIIYLPTNNILYTHLNNFNIFIYILYFSIGLYTDIFIYIYYIFIYIHILTIEFFFHKIHFTPCSKITIQA